MSTNESLLALARAVYPDYEWKIDGNYPYRMVRMDRYVIFNPAGDDRQYQGASECFVALLCWGMRNGINIRNDEVFWYQGHNDLIAKRISHDNTPASLRAAIVQAAGRVVAG